jgi:hypothetical protein
MLEFGRCHNKELNLYFLPNTSIIVAIKEDEICGVIGTHGRTSESHIRT